jgi:hypothetical protein
MKPAEVLAAFDRYLAARNLRLEAVVIGGAALNLLGVVSRPTRDCDILLPPLPAAIVEAARAFAAEVRRSGGTLADDWLNNGPHRWPTSFRLAGRSDSSSSSQARP